MAALLLSLITFLSAFLLFQIELIIAKIFLPDYGGSYLVWGSCVVFFQAVLLAGYWFVHRVTRSIGIDRYRIVHTVILLLPLVTFPGRNLDVSFAGHSLALVIDVFFRLALTIGPVFFVLSTISITTQMWLSQARFDRLNPYTLYAVSNVGSFIALFSYPFVFEVIWNIPQQLQIWRLLYFVLIGLNILALFKIPLIRNENPVSPQDDAPCSQPKLRWILLGAGGSMLFLSVNNLSTYELPPMPLFWIFPLGVYLLSFVLNFKKNPWDMPWIEKHIAPILGVSAVSYLFIQKVALPALVEFVLLLGLLFVLSMYCQGELVRSKPANTKHLTVFYCWISLGSLLGSLLVTWIVPLISLSMMEFILSLVVVAIAAQKPWPAHISEIFKPALDNLGNAQVSRMPYVARLIVYFNLFLVLWAAYFIKYHFWGMLFLFLMVWIIYREMNKSRFAVVISLVIFVVILPFHEALWDRKATNHVWKHRNYYGIYQIVDRSGIRWLYHGGTLHGAQYLHPDLRSKALTYYAESSGVGEIIDSDLLRPVHAAFIGLGTGTLLTYLKEHQTLDIYELDPDVYKIADEKFYFLRESRTSRRIFLGDARVALTKVNDRDYDLVVIDAFSGDAIPVHLLTAEAFELYRQRLSDRGILMIHISNRYVNLLPVISRTVQVSGGELCRKFSKNEGGVWGADWVIVTWNPAIYQVLLKKYRWEEITPEKFPGFRPWSDGYSSVLPIVRIEDLLKNLKNFKFYDW